MLLETYDEQGLLFITTMLGKTTTAGLSAFRGDLVLIEGALREGSTSNRDRKTPEMVLHQSAILADSEKMLLVSGLLFKLEDLAVLVEKHKAALTADTVAVLYVENIAKNMEIVLNGVTFKLVPYKEGMVWNETLELLYIEKADLKGLSAEDKVIAVYEAAKDFKTKVEPIGYEEALTQTIEVKKEAAVGPV